MISASVRLLQAAIAALALASMALPAVAKDRPDLVPHRVIYQFANMKVAPESGITNIRGALYFDLRRTCTAYVLSQRFAFEVTRRGRKSTRLETRSVATESLDGLHYRFRTQTRIDGITTQKYRGTANLTRPGGSGTVTLAPESDGRLAGKARFALPKNSYFPLSHTVETLRRANANAALFWANIFDGSDGGKTSASSVVFGPRVPVPAVALTSPLLAGSGHWLKLSFFEGKQQATPDYAIRFYMLPNGVASYIRLIYDGYEFTADPKVIEKHKIPTC